MLRQYDSTIKDQIQRGMVEPVEESSGDPCSKICYLPHHAVIRSDKETTKIRVVYDASARSDGPSLDDCLHAGPKYDQKILDILLRFRVHRVAIVADIEKAFLMVAMARKDQDALHFLWFDDVFSDQPNLVHWVSVKPGLWTLDWTMDWTGLDWTGISKFVFVHLGMQLP